MENREFYRLKYSNVTDQNKVWRDLTGAVKAGNIQKLISNQTVPSVIEIGAGTGSIINCLDDHGFSEQFFALDITDEAVNLIKQRQDIPHLVDARVFDGKKIPYQTDSFFLAVLSHVIEHIQDPIPLLKEAARIAKYLAVEVPLEDNLYTRIKVKLFKSRYHKETGHILWLNQRSFRILLEEQCHFQILVYRMVYVPEEIYLYYKRHSNKTLARVLYGIKRILRFVSERLYTSLLTDHCIALVCKKDQ